MSAKEKEDQDRERRNRMKQEVEEKRKEALLRKQHDEAKRAEDLKRKDEEWKKKAEGPVRVPNMAAGGSDKAKDARSAADSGDKAKYNVKDPKSNIPSLNKKPEVVPVSSKPAGIVVTGSQEKATSAAPKRPRSPDPAPEEPRKQAKLEPQSAVPVKPSKAIAEVAPAVKVVGPSAAPKPFAVEVPKPAVPPASMKPIANPILSPGFLAPPKGQPSPQSITELYGGEIPDIPSE